MHDTFSLVGKWNVARSWCCCHRTVAQSVLGWSDFPYLFTLVVFGDLDPLLLVIPGVRCLHTKLLAYWMCLCPSDWLFAFLSPVICFVERPDLIRQSC